MRSITTASTPVKHIGGGSGQTSLAGGVACASWTSSSSSPLDPSSPECALPLLPDDALLVEAALLELAAFGGAGCWTVGTMTVPVPPPGVLFFSSGAMTGAGVAEMMVVSAIGSSPASPLIAAMDLRRGSWQST